MIKLKCLQKVEFRQLINHNMNAIFYFLDSIFFACWTLLGLYFLQKTPQKHRHSKTFRAKVITAYHFVCKLLAPFQDIIIYFTYFNEKYRVFEESREFLLSILHE